MKDVVITITVRLLEAGTRSDDVAMDVQHALALVHRQRFGSTLCNANAKTIIVTNPITGLNLTIE